MVNEYDLTQGKVWNTLFKYFLPVALGGIVQTLYNTADGYIVANYVGTEAFAAISGSVTIILNVMVGTFIALTGGAAVYIAQLYGVGDKEKIKKAVTTSMWLCIILGVILSVIGLIYAEDMLVLMKTPDDTLAEATVYLKYCFAAASAVMLYNMGASILRASGDSKRPFIYLCACSLTNIVLDVVAVKYLNMGVLGAAAATAFSQFVSFILVLIRMIKTDEAYKLSLRFKDCSWHALEKTIGYGIPSGAQQFLYGITNIAIQVCVNILGTLNVAAWSLTSKVDGIYWAIINAAGVAVMNFVGQNYGAGRLDRVKEATKKSMIYFMGFTIGVAALLIGFGRSILPWFLDDPSVCEVAYKLMTIFVSTYFTWTVIEVIGGVLKGCGDVLVPAIILLVGIAGIRLLGLQFLFDDYHDIYFLAYLYPVSWIITAVSLLIRYKGGRWKKKKEL